ncbi:MAG: hypothetical protein ACRD3E_11630 [Terriglobales bacterium]
MNLALAMVVVFFGVLAASGAQLLRATARYFDARARSLTVETNLILSNTRQEYVSTLVDASLGKRTKSRAPSNPSREWKAFG